MTIDELKKEVLKNYQYRKFDDNGHAEGCLLPIYLLHTDLPRYAWVEEHMLNNVITALKQNLKETNDIEPGNVLAFRMPFRQVHIGVYCGEGQMIHCTQNTGLEICQTSLFISRLEGVFK